MDLLAIGLMGFLIIIYLNLTSRPYIYIYIYLFYFYFIFLFNQCQKIDWD